MKKIFALIIIISLVIVTFFDIKNINTKKEDTLDKTSSTYKVEEQENLIIEELPNENKNQNITEEEFTTYIEEINKDVITITEKEQLTQTEKNTLTNTFITLTDFIFYEGEIKGTTFKELTASAKEKVIDIYETIDAKIESVYPGYKEKIKDTSSKTYTNIKSKLSELKTELLDKYKSELGEEKYNDQVKTFNESKEAMESSFEPVIDTIVEESKQVYEDTKEKLDNWYQTWKEENK